MTSTTQALTPAGRIASPDGTRTTEFATMIVTSDQWELTVEDATVAVSSPADQAIIDLRTAGWYVLGSHYDDDDLDVEVMVFTRTVSA